MPKREDEEREENYKEFLEEPNLERESRSKVLKPGKVQAIHLSEDARPAWGNIQDKPELYTKDEVDALTSREMTTEMWFFSILGS